MPIQSTGVCKRLDTRTASLDIDRGSLNRQVTSNAYIHFDTDTLNMILPHSRELMLSMGAEEWSADKSEISIIMSERLSSQVVKP